MSKRRQTHIELLKESLTRISGVRRWEIASDLYKTAQEFSQIGKAYRARGAQQDGR